MKRRTIRISPSRAAFGGLLCLLLGAVTTVGVAWGCSLWKPFLNVDADFEDVSSEDRHIRWLHDDAPESWNKTPGTVYSLECFGFTRDVYFEQLDVYFEHSFDGDIVDAEFARFATQETAGWPMRAMLGSGSYSKRTSDGSYETPDETALILIDIPWLPIPSDTIPTHPIFPGFIINTLFYAVIWYGIFIGIGTTRRAIRRSRGRCVKCAYDLRGNLSTIEKSALSSHLDSQVGRLRHQSFGCPECGWNRSESTLAETAEQTEKEQSQ